MIRVSSTVEPQHKSLELHENYKANYNRSEIIHKSNFEKIKLQLQNKIFKTRNTEGENELGYLTERLQKLEIQNLQKSEVFNPTL